MNTALSKSSESQMLVKPASQPRHCDKQQPRGKQRNVLLLVLAETQPKLI